MQYEKYFWFQPMFWYGVLWPIAIGLICLIVGRHYRHRCKTEGCGCRTKTVYLMFHLHKIPTTIDGLMTYGVYKFRKCEKGHVIPSMKTKKFANWQIEFKPHEQLVWNTDEVDELCAQAGIRNPWRDYMFGNHSDQDVTPTILPIKAGDTAQIRRPRSHAPFLRRTR